MTGREGHDIDPHASSLEARVERVEGRYQLLEQGTGMSMKHLTAAVDAMQADVRKQTELAQQTRNEVAGMRTHSEGLARLSTALNRYIERQDEAFTKHCAENKITADAVVGFKSAITVISWVFCIVAALSTALISFQFDVIRNSHDKIEGRIERLERRP